ncbi:MAG TPA: AbrB/MazE/SpoVT family DNA-binding domain-containing protein [Bryobacteraceae bacterium]|nr:AbrB/MazE/SpoVT family DNA-binding domain-containing protein [Bryobacteraceae bacterium]
MAQTAKLTIQRWGNSLALRIPSAVARSAGIQQGQPVEISVHDSSVVITPIGEPRLTLAQKLALFDPGKHGGEVMATKPVGREVM